MRIITLNCNGIRSAARKGLYPWLVEQSADIICLQETRAGDTELSTPDFSLDGYQAAHVHAQRKGYSGVSIYTRLPVTEFVTDHGSSEFDIEGRYLELKAGDLSVISAYFPSGSSGAERQEAKFRFLAEFRQHLQAITDSGRRYILCGDLNIAHRNIDIKNWRGKQTTSGFLPEERAWLEELFTAGGFVDAFRLVNDQPEQYTWWSNSGQAWAKNVGWRIDYQVISAALAPHVRAASIWKDTRFSDHAPVIVDYADVL